MKSLPDNIVSYKRTPEFDETTVPVRLLSDHQTKAGVWAKIVVLSGKLLYTIQQPFEEIILDANKCGVVEPTVLHQVKPIGQVLFYVEFYQ